ncbi:CD48 antigen-like [Micropterus dolomieu]|uniref:CD48 antigen-like n=1 Tax=Micropterus dolomieu TaxID=147949 RepID=UPI001E8E229C|nr:CD48 antigen-like [Micropterus dolomieu]
MSIFVILGLLVCTETRGSSAVTPVFVQKGKDVLLNVRTADVPQNFVILSWGFNKKVLVTYSPDKEPTVFLVYTGRIETDVKKYSLKLNNLQEADSGVYTARLTGEEERILAEYNVRVQGPVSPVELSVDSVSSSSDSCNLTVTCRTQDSHISSTFTCDTQTCSQEGGERSEVTTSGASLHVYLLNDSIICNHSNQVSWTEDIKKTKHYCPQHADPESLSAGISVCLVKTVVFSVGLIIMVSAVICVHIMEKLKKQK